MKAADVKGDRKKNKVAMRKESMRKAKERQKNPPTRKVALEGGMCGAKRKNGTFCRQGAGWGTDHVGYGRCRRHGGTAPTHRANAVKNQAILLGAPKEINPIDAIMWCIHITAGEVEWLTQQMESLDKKDWVESTIMGKQFNMLARERRDRVMLLEKYAKDAIALGIAERAVRLAENYGASIARYTENLLNALRLTPEQKARAPQVVRQALIALESGRFSVQPKAIAELEAGDAA